MSLLFKILYIFVNFIETLIIFRIVLSIIGGEQTHTFVGWVYSMSDIFILPFTGIVAQKLDINNLSIHTTPIVALIFYSILGFILSELSKSLKKTD